MRSVWNEVFVRRFFEWGGGGGAAVSALEMETWTPRRSVTRTEPTAASGQTTSSPCFCVESDG